MRHNQAKELFLKYQSGKCSPEEKAIVENWLTFGEATGNNLTDEQLKEDIKDLDARIRLHTIRKNPFRYNLPIAAALLMMLGLGFYFYKSTTTSDTTLVENYSSLQDIKPGGNVATLIFADGQKIQLKNIGDSTLMKKGNLSIINKRLGKLIYHSINHKNLTNELNAENISDLHTLITPRGGQYQIILPDGTKVWLNSASSLKFPAHFEAHERNVELNGEAYFEVAKNVTKPFNVKVNSTVVKVLGTHFNIMAYENQSSIKTTLLEGSVQLKRKGSTTILKPGQQGIVSKKGAITVINTGVEQATAWKNGYFLFNKASLPDIMHQLSRWYDVDVIYRGKIPEEEEFVGKIERTARLSDILQVLELSGHHFTIESRNIIVTPH